VVTITPTDEAKSLDVLATGAKIEKCSYGFGRENSPAANRVLFASLADAISTLIVSAIR
jgi:hypothetical protein